MDIKRILYALKALNENVENSKLTDSEKNAIRVLIARLLSHVEKKEQEIEETKNYYFARNKLLKLVTEMTDYIVSINDAIQGKEFIVNENSERLYGAKEVVKTIDVMAMVNGITKEINREERNFFWKRKR